MRLVVVADSDSYVKWGAALAGSLPDGWQRELLVIESKFTVNDTQLRSALRDSGIEQGTRVRYRELGELLTGIAPDAVLVAAPGPVARVLIRLVAGLRPCPVIVSGLPGISIPATVKALRFRLQSDLMVVHSHREVREFTALSREHGWDHRLALARLPFTTEHPVSGTDLVFAPQAVVPRAREDRVEVARMLRDAALADLAHRVVVKLRALAGERSTHPEDDAYPELLAALGPIPDNLVFSDGPMSRALDTAAGLVTVSSTALIEAVARGIPVIAIDTFGVTAALINPVFEGSGLFGGRDAVVAREFRDPDVAWLADNYFHDAAESDWAASLEELVAARRAGRLPARSGLRMRGGASRAAWDRKRALGAADPSLSGRAALVVGVPLRALVLAGHRLRRAASGARTS
ncbi:DUF6716 putative glycosyltransferase [Protaetiibacter larvae]|uniref:Diacylglycerol glucosyltransferase N-terminal domain-containing protein n=1 Tax=Protaetiibacter larvae TaxID=2592654 RepID=A0A5C1Y9C6_9MICO|nr:DUF6716 putative glycosyltransferase [Protaetiibacter larvae]QEO10481.1 hypothetical protein FLP23_10980 [Protaetiibacter larvae]